MLILAKTILKFDYNLTTVDFLPNTADFQSSDQLTEENCDPRLETWHEYSWRSIMNDEIHLRHYKTNCPCENQNPNLGS